MREKIFNKINQIETVLWQEWNNPEYSDISLTSGIGGLPIFYYSLYKAKKKKEHLDKLEVILEGIFNKLNTDDYGLTYSSGLTGVAYVLNFLRKRQFLRGVEINDNLNFIDDLLANYVLKNLKSIEDSDFVHGALGIAFYLNERYDINPKIFESLREIFEKIAYLISEDIKKTENVQSVLEYNDSTHRTNCGLAHGHISTIIIFSKFLKKFPESQIIRSTLIKSIDCVLSFESKDNSNISSFPGIAINKNIASYNIHLGWCYGDQAVSIGLYYASLVLMNKDLSLKAKEIALKTLKRNTIIKLEKTHKNIDEGFCHGLSSVAYIHKKWYLITNNKKFKNSYHHFIGEIINRSKGNVGLAGYQKFEDNNTFKNAIGLLDGIIGIGLVLIDSVYDDKTQWDELFLLS